MAFPTSPSNNQVHRESGSNRTFVYDSTLGVWDQVKEAQSDISNIAGHISNEVTGFAGIRIFQKKTGLLKAGFIKNNFF